MANRRSRSWRSCVWLAWFAVALNALAPGITQAAAWLQGRPLGIALEAGRPLGWAAGNAAQAHHHAHHHPPQHHGAGGHGEHCPFCFTHAGSFALPPLPPLAGVPAASRDAAGVAMPHAPVPRVDVRIAAQPRAPPAIG